jgi:hypothetical protein
LAGEFKINLFRKPNPTRVPNPSRVEIYAIKPEFINPKGFD